MPRSQSSPSSLYSVHPGVAMMQDWIASLPAKTGKSIDQWVSLTRKDGPESPSKRREWLMKTHGFGTNAAWWIAERVDGKDDESDPKSYLKAAVQYVEEMYSGAKAGLRPLHDRLLQLARSIGQVRVCPCKTIVPIYREHVIAQIKPSTRTRIDFGVALKGAKRMPGKRWLDTGGLQKGDRITHRVPISSLDDIDDDVEKWIKIAYALDAP